jgi:hypothetical protein
MKKEDGGTAEGLMELVERILSQYEPLFRFPIDPRRVYLMGHSGGAGHDINTPAGLRTAAQHLDELRDAGIGEFEWIGPVRQHDDREQPQRELVLRTIDPLKERRRRFRIYGVDVCGVHGGLVFKAPNGPSIV